MSSPLARKMAFYAAHHRDPRNKATHFVGVPMIIVSLMIPLDWVRLVPRDLPTGPVTLASLIAAGLVLYYLRFSRPLALAMVPAFGGMLATARHLAPAPDAAGWAMAARLFVLGWVIQLIGHALEGRRPALLDSWPEIFTAPLFLAAEAAMLLGFYPDLAAEVEDLAATI